jgi:hypothetical protein
MDLNQIQADFLSVNTFPQKPNCLLLDLSVLNSKQTNSDCAKTPDPSVSSGLKGKNKTIRVLLDSGSSGDLLFLKKGSSKHISIVKRVVP